MSAKVPSSVMANGEQRNAEAEVVRARLPDVPEAVALRVCAAVARLRGEDLYKVPGVGETIVWARTLLALDHADLEGTLGVALKAREDIDQVRERGARGCLRRAPGSGMPAALRPCTTSWRATRSPPWRLWQR